MKKAGEFLKGIRRADALVKRKREQIERLRNLAEYRSPIMDPNGGGRGGGRDTRGEVMCKVVDMEKELEHDVARLLEDRMVAMRMIDSLDNADVVSVLYMRYLDGRSWQEIAYELDRTVQWVYELNRRGIRRLERMEAR